MKNCHSAHRCGRLRPYDKGTNKAKETMNVYAVIAGIDYEGENLDTMQLFDCKSAAQAYRDELIGQCGVDYVKMEVFPVQMQSAIAA